MPVCFFPVLSFENIQNHISIARPKPEHSFLLVLSVLLALVLELISELERLKGFVELHLDSFLWVFQREERRRKWELKEKAKREREREQETENVVVFELFEIIFTIYLRKK